MRGLGTLEGLLGLKPQASRLQPQPFRLLPTADKLVETLDGISQPGPIACSPPFAIGRMFWSR